MILNPTVTCRLCHKAEHALIGSYVHDDAALEKARAEAIEHGWEPLGKTWMMCPSCAAQQKEHKRKSALDHLFHVWINQRQDARRKEGQEWEGSLYEWKTALAETERLPIWLKRARTGALPTQHRQCSHSEVEEISENRLVCALGRDVTECPILQSWYASFDTERERTHKDGSRSYYGENTEPDDADVVAAQICTWHIFTTVFRVGNERTFIDTSGGYVQDEGDRRFWTMAYEHMRAGLFEEDVP